MLTAILALILIFILFLLTCYTIYTITQVLRTGGNLSIPLTPYGISWSRDWVTHHRDPDMLHLGYFSLYRSRSNQH